MCIYAVNACISIVAYVLPNRVLFTSVESGDGMQTAFPGSFIVGCS